MDAWSGYWKTGARRSPATISITLTGATPPRRSLRFWRNCGPTLIYKQGEYMLTPSAFFHPALTRARGSMFTHFTPADLVAILNIPRLQTLPNSFKILREYRLSVVALVFSR